MLQNAVSSPSDANGIVTFTNLTITGTSSPYVFLGFYCEGQVASWSLWFQGGDAVSNSLSTVAPQNPMPVTGIRADTTVAAVSATVPPSVTVVEGQPFVTQPRVTVSDASGHGLAGKVRVNMVLVGSLFDGGGPHGWQWSDGNARRPQSLAFPDSVPSTCWCGPCRSCTRW